MTAVIVAYLLIGAFAGLSLVHELPADTSGTGRITTFLMGLLTWPGFAISWLIRAARGK